MRLPAVLLHRNEVGQEMQDHTDRDDNRDTRINPLVGWDTKRGDGPLLALEIVYVDLESGSNTGPGRRFSIGLSPAFCRLLAEHLLAAANGNLGMGYPPPS
jgi:hypothetical protein